MIAIETEEPEHTEFDVRTSLSAAVKSPLRKVRFRKMHISLAPIDQQLKTPCLNISKSQT